MPSYLLHQSQLPQLTSLEDFLVLLSQIYSPHLYDHFINPGTFHITACYRALNSPYLYTLVIDKLAPKSEWDFLCLNFGRALSDVILTTAMIQRSESNLDVSLLGRPDVVKYLYEFRNSILQKRKLIDLHLNYNERRYQLNQLPDLLILSRLITSQSLEQMCQVLTNLSNNNVTINNNFDHYLDTDTNIRSNSTSTNRSSNIPTNLPSSTTGSLSNQNSHIYNKTIASLLKILIQFPPQLSLNFCLHHVNRQQRSVIYTPSFVSCLISNILQPILIFISTKSDQHNCTSLNDDDSQSYHALMGALGPLSDSETEILSKWTEFLTPIQVISPQPSHQIYLQQSLNDQTPNQLDSTQPESTTRYPSSNINNPQQTQTTDNGIYLTSKLTQSPYVLDTYSNITRSAIHFLSTTCQYRAISLEAGPVTTHNLYFPPDPTQPSLSYMTQSHLLCQNEHVSNFLKFSHQNSNIQQSTKIHKPNNNNNNDKLEAQRDDPCQFGKNSRDPHQNHQQQTQPTQYSIPKSISTRYTPQLQQLSPNQQNNQGQGNLNVCSAQDDDQLEEDLTPLMPNYLLLSVYSDDTNNPPQPPNIAIKPRAVVQSQTRKNNSNSISKQQPHEMRDFEPCLISLSTVMLDNCYQLQCCPFRPYPFLPLLSSNDFSTHNAANNSGISNSDNINNTNAADNNNNQTTNIPLKFDLDFYSTIEDGTIDLHPHCTLYNQFYTKSHHNDLELTNVDDPQQNPFDVLKSRIKLEIAVPYIKSQLMSNSGDFDGLSTETFISHLTTAQSKLQYYPQFNQPNSTSFKWQDVKFSDVVQKVGWTMFLLKKK